MKEYMLKIAQAGFAAGPVFDVETTREKTSPSDFPETDSPDRELCRFEEAVLALGRELSLAAAGADEKTAAIFEAEKLLLEDEWYAGAVRKLIREDGLCAVSAVEKTGADLTQRIAGMENDYLRQRSDDVKGVTKMLLGILRGDQKRKMEVPSILVADELSPAQLLGAASSMILGMITTEGSPSSHVSILAGNLGVPYAYGSAEAVADARAGSRVILEDDRLIIDPDDEMYRHALKKQEERTRLKEVAVPVGSTRTRVCANISGPEDLAALQASRAEGVGLFRSEFLFLDRAQAPSEEEQYSAYACVTKAMGEKETVIRTMDLGSDKKPDWLPLPDEKNPALGWRGLRVSLKERELFKTQIRALLRAADAGNLKVMVPMVTSVREVEAVRDCIRECAGELSKEGVRHRIPPLGVMIETPAAALIAGELAKEVDFFSIGTNDLTQYTLALDREACGLEDYYEPCHEAVLKLIQMTAAAGHDHQIPTSVCGELAGDPWAIPKLVEAGVDKLSVSLPKIEATLAHVLAAEKKLPQEPEQAPEEGMIAAPADGKLIPMEDIPDPVFSSGAMGECAGILPENGMIYAPCDGTVTGIAQTKHAITFTSADGKQILVHVGIDTVRLNGKGFTVFVKEGSAISKGDKVMEADLNVIRSAGLSTIVITACIQ